MLSITEQSGFAARIKSRIDLVFFLSFFTYCFLLLQAEVRLISAVFNGK